MFITLTRYGKWEVVLLTLVFAAACWAAVSVGYPMACLALTVVWLCVLSFFRDPARRVPEDPNALVAPADGRVTEITRLDNDERIGGPAWRIGIFLSIFDVHLNRSPCRGTVRHRYNPAATSEWRNW